MSRKRRNRPKKTNPAPASARPEPPRPHTVWLRVDDGKGCSRPGTIPGRVADRESIIAHAARRDREVAALVSEHGLDGLVVSLVWTPWAEIQVTEAELEYLQRHQAPQPRYVAAEYHESASDCGGLWGQFFEGE
jgi:hypothetical protein